MSNQAHLELLLRGQDAWNQWRMDNPEVRPDLSHADLSKIDLHSRTLKERLNLRQSDLTRTNLRQANLDAVDLSFSILRGADLIGAYLGQSILYGADLSEASADEANLQSADMRQVNLGGADLLEARLPYADLSDANLQNANLEHAILIGTKLSNANLEGARIYGISAWDVELDGANQSNLVVTNTYQPLITVDNIEVAQFIHLLLNNHKIREVIDSVTSKTVLILGRFTPERKLVLDAIRTALRKRNFVPMVFDFAQPKNRNLTETISTLAHISRFVVADITEARSIPQELQMIIPHLPSVPVQPLIEWSESEYGMFEDFMDYPWVSAPFRYKGIEDLLASLDNQVISPAMTKLHQSAMR